MRDVHVRQVALKGFFGRQSRVSLGLELINHAIHASHARRLRAMCQHMGGIMPGFTLPQHARKHELRRD